MQLPSIVCRGLVSLLACVALLAVPATAAAQVGIGARRRGATERCDGEAAKAADDDGAPISLPRELEQLAQRLPALVARPEDLAALVLLQHDLAVVVGINPDDIEDFG